MVMGVCVSISHLAPVCAPPSAARIMSGTRGLMMTMS